MLKTIIFIYSLTLCLSNASAQTHYFKMYGTNDKDKGYILTRTCDKGFVLAGISEKYDNSEDVLILKIDSSGSVKWEWNIGFNAAADVPISVIETPDSNIVVFISSDMSNVKMRMAVFNYDGNMILEKHDYFLSGGFPDFELKGALLLPDGRIVTPVVVNDSILKAYWWNQVGDTLSSIVLDTCKQYAFSSFNKIYQAELFLYDDTLIFSFNNNISAMTDGVTIIKTDYNGLAYSLKTHSNFNFDIPNVLILYDNIFLCSRNGMGNSIYSYLYDYEADSVFNELYYSDSNTDIGCLNECLSYDSLLLYCGRVLYNLDSTKAFLLKMNTLGNEIWFRTYHPFGYDRSYLYSVKQYSDCIAAVGYAYDSEDADSYDILFVKADLNGEATSITTFEQTGRELRVFPNPVKDMLSVNLITTGKSNYTITDAAGRIVLTGNTENNQIQVSSLPAAYYLLQWENDGKIYKANFVKE